MKGGGGLAVLLGTSKDKPSDESSGGELEDAMSDLGEALMDKDWGAAASAFRRACSLCEDSYEDSSDEE